MARKYRHTTETGEFDRAGHETAQANERVRRGAKSFTRIDKFNEYMSKGAQQNERRTRANATNQGFASQYESKLAGLRGRRKR